MRVCAVASRFKAACGSDKDDEREEYEEDGDMGVCGVMGEPERDI